MPEVLASFPGMHSNNICCDIGLRLTSEKNITHVQYKTKAHACIGADKIFKNNIQGKAQILIKKRVMGACVSVGRRRVVGGLGIA